MTTLSGQMAKILDRHACPPIEAEFLPDTEEESLEVKWAAKNNYPLMLADTMANGTGGKYYHAHTHDARGGSGAALCGRKPGKRGYWGHYFGDEVTCPKCLKYLGMQGAADDALFAMK